MLERLYALASGVYIYNKSVVGNRLILISSYVTSLLLMTFCAILSGQQYFDVPIQCLQDQNDGDVSVPEEIMNSFCFITNTYGRLDFSHDARREIQTDVKKHTFYPWVSVVILLQGLSFMAPQTIWAVGEKSFIADCLKEPIKFFMTDDLKTIARYLAKRLNSFGGWACSILSCEISFAANIIGNFFFTDWFLSGQFWDYGYKSFLGKSMHGDIVFPKMTKCTFFKYGPSGEIQNKEAFCLMTLNVFNEKMYLFLWFWFILLFFLSCMILLRRAIFFMLLIFRRYCNFLMGIIFMNNLSQEETSILLNNLSFSDWIFFEHTKSLMDVPAFNTLMKLISTEISDQKKSDSHRISPNAPYPDYVSIYDM